MNQDPNATQTQEQPKEKKELTLEDKEKSNKKVALIIMIALCSIFVVMGLVGGVVKFMRFVDEMNPQEQVTPTNPENEFYNDGKLSFRNGGQVIAEYTCEHASCGWAYATTDDAQYELRTPDVGDGSYELKGIVNDRYGIIYDDESSNSTSNIIIFDIQENKSVLQLTGIKNYNMDTGNLYIAKDKNGKWGVISLSGTSIETVVNYQYDYIGVVLQEGESFKEQQLYAALKDNTWFIISATQSSGVVSGEFSDPIITYNHKLVVTKSTTDGIFYNLYTLHGEAQALEKDVNDVILPGYNILITYTTDGNNKRVVVYDAGNGKEIFVKKLVSLQGVTAETKDGKLIVKDADAKTLYEQEAKATTISIDDAKYIKEVDAPTSSNYDNYSGDGEETLDDGGEDTGEAPTEDNGENE